MLVVPGARALLRGASTAAAPRLPSPAASTSCDARAALAGRSLYYTSLTSRQAASSSFSSSSSLSPSPPSQDPAKPVKPKRARRRSKAEMEADEQERRRIRNAKLEAKRLRDLVKARQVARARSKQGLSLKAMASASSPTSKRRKCTDDDELDGQAAEAAVQAEPLLTDVEAREKMNFDHMPPRDDWKAHYPVGKAYLTHYRYFAANRETISRVVKAMDIGKDLKGGIKATVIEGYPGPGTFTSELLKEPQVEKVVALEQAPSYLDSLYQLQQVVEAHEKVSEQEQAKLAIHCGTAYDWMTYNAMISAGHLSHLQGRVPSTADTTVDFTNEASLPTGYDDLSWQDASPLFFFAQLPNAVHGEQLFAQIIHAIASRLWLFRYGRVRFGFVCGEVLAKRCLGQAGDRVNRGKLGTTVQCLADVEIHYDSDELSPHHHHFFPPTLSIGPRVPISGGTIIPNSNPSTGLTRTGLCAMTLTPKRQPLLKQREIEAFEFVTRNMFVLKSKSVREAMTHIAPGGQNVLRMLGAEKVREGVITHAESIDPETKVHDLTNVQWVCLARTFEKWPFRPEHLFEVGGIKTDKRGR